MLDCKRPKARIEDLVFTWKTPVFHQILKPTKQSLPYVCPCAHTGRDQDSSIDFTGTENLPQKKPKWG
jgi:hypothetical protein